MKSITLMSLLAGAFLTTGVSTVFAADKACSADLQKFCSSAQTWKEKGACLKEHKSELSPGCVAARKERREVRKQKVAEFKKACEADIKSQCSNIPSGQGKGREVFQCLKNNENSLSTGCKAELAQVHKHQRKSGSVTPAPVSPSQTPATNNSQSS